MRGLRFWIALAGSIIVIGSLLAIASVWKWNVEFGLPRSADKVTRINTIVAASAYIAAIVAAVFALIAYWQASGLPSLEPEISFLPLDAPLWATSGEPPPWVKVDWSPFRFIYRRTEHSVPIIDRTNSDRILTVVLTNKTKYAARNPGLRIQFDGLLFNGIPTEWTSVERWGEWNGLRAIQWDGGTDNIIHGKWSRTLPIVGFNEVVVSSDNPTLVLTVVADGCDPKEFRFPLHVTVHEFGE